MARVVQRRSTPPYLLIVFVFLFLLSAILAILGFLSGGEEKRENVNLKVRVDDLRKTNEELTDQLSDVVQKITAQDGTALSAIQAADAAYDNPTYQAAAEGRQGGLANDLVALAEVIVRQKEALQKLNAELEQKNKQLGLKTQTLQDQQQTHETQLASLREEKSKVSAALAGEKQARDQAISDVQGTLARSQEELQQELAVKERLLEEKVLEVAELEKKIRRLEYELGLKRRGESRNILNQVAGRIEKIARNANVCYINIGRTDRVQPGVTFAVYDKKGLKDEHAKGGIQVTHVSDDFSECKILREDSDAPIVVGDEIANLAFHTTRQHVFVVQGLFDLHGTDSPSSYGANEVQKAIRTFGGKIADEVTLQTDYVVMGQEPEKPVQPAPDAPTSVQQAYQKQLQRYREYQDVQTAAESMKIPILNTNRFLMLTGYEPETGPE